MAAALGAMTFAGGLGHTLPFLLPDTGTALAIAYVVVAIELILISWIRYHYFGMGFTHSALQVLGGGILVFIVEIVLGQS